MRARLRIKKGASEHDVFIIFEDLDEAGESAGHGSVFSLKWGAGLVEPTADDCVRSRAWLRSRLRGAGVDVADDE